MKGYIGCKRIKTPDDIKNSFSHEADDKWYTSAVDFTKRNKESINKYGIIPALATVSLPVAGAYMARNDGFKEILVAAGMGVVLTSGLSFALDSYQTRNINEFDSGKIVVEHKYSHNSSSETNEEGFLDSISNYGIGKALMNSPRNEITEILVTGRYNGDEFSCSYEMDGFNLPQSININELKPSKVTFNGSEVNGDLGVNLYGGLCKQIFEEDKKYF